MIQHHGGALLEGQTVNSTQAEMEMENCIFENNLIYRPHNSIYYSYVAMDAQKCGWDARNNTYVANSDYVASVFSYETVDRIDHRMFKYNRVFMPYNERYIKFLTARGMDPSGKYRYYTGLTDAEKAGLFFMTSYCVERGILPDIK